MLGRWALTARLGLGTTSIVYRGIDESGRVAAIKTLAPGVVSIASERLLAREASLLSHLELDGVVGLIGFSTEDRPHMAVDLVDGPTVADLCYRKGALHVLQGLQLAEELAMTLAQLHALGVAHGDIKPANIVLGRNRCILVDFGNALVEGSPLTWFTGPLHSPAWLAPEMYNGGPPTPEADVFAWSATVATALLGQLGSGMPTRVAELLAEAALPIPADRPTALELLHELRARRAGSWATGSTRAS